MNNATTFVGLDVHARSVKACAFVPETGETVGKSFGYEPGEIASWAASLPQPAKCVYESRLSKFLLRHGFVYDGKNAAGQRRSRWTRDFRAQVGRIDLGDASATAALDHYRECVREADARKAALDEKVKSLSRKPRWKPSCDALKCPKGIDAVTAVSIACEADGFSRFATASGFAAWVGSVPSEHSSGESQCRGGIAKAGNKHLRRLLVEAAWHYKGASRSPKDLAQGSIGRRGDQAPRQRRREAPGRQASRLGRGRQAEQRGQRRGRARAGVLVPGRWPHGGRRLAGAPPT